MFRTEILIYARLSVKIDACATICPSRVSPRDKIEEFDLLEADEIPRFPSATLMFANSPDNSRSRSQLGL